MHDQHYVHGIFTVADYRGVVRGGHGWAFALPSEVVVAPPSTPFALSLETATYLTPNNNE